MSVSPLNFAVLLGFFWACVLACLTQFTEVGRWATTYMTWFVVALGVGGEVLIMYFYLVDHATGYILWWDIITMFFVASIPMTLQGIIDLFRYFKGLLRDNANKVSQ